MFRKKGKVLIAAPVHAVLTTGLEEAGYELCRREQITQQEAYALLADCVGVITSTRLQLDAGLIDAAPHLEFIGRMGSGMEVIDVSYATAKGIRCIGSPAGNCNAVAEHALGMLLALNKKIVKSFEELKGGRWLRDANRGTELEGKTIGIIGFGHTGTAFAKLLSGFDVRVLAYDKYVPVASSGNVSACSSPERIYEEADILSFHVPSQQDTYHLFDAAFADRMKKPFVLVNTSRGTVVETSLIKKMLDEGRMRGAVLDVWEEEPLEKMSPKLRSMLEELLSYPNVIITPHIAGYSMEALFKMSRILLEGIIR